MTLHTKGPWLAPDGPFVGGHYVSKADGSADICQMPDWPFELRMEEEANAKLIAAAPDLLEAAKMALNYIKNTESELDIKLDCGGALRAAIGKAAA